MSVLELNHVKKSFNNGTLHVLKDISLSVEKGEVVAIIGPSGSGKSTLLRCATLLERIDSGEVCFDGHYAARTGDQREALTEGETNICTFSPPVGCADSPLTEGALSLPP